MKKIKLFALAAFAMLSTNVLAQEVTPSDGTWKYTVNEDGKTATLVSLVDSKVGTIEDLKIPATVAGEGTATYKVTDIAEGAFAGDAKIKTVTFTADIKTIGAAAFDNCYNLTTVTFPASSALEFIDDAAFARTDQLKKIDLSNTKLYNFGEATPFVVEEGTNIALEEIVLAAKTTDIGVALAGLTKLSKTNISATKIQTIHANAFDGDAKLTSLELPVVNRYDPETGEPNPWSEPTMLEAGALEGSSIATLTINGAVNGYYDNEEWVPGIAGDLGGVALTTVNFKGVVGFIEGEGDEAEGKIAIPAGAFAGATKLATVTFAEVLEGAIEDGSFTDAATATATSKLTFTITKATAVVFTGDEGEDAGLKAFNDEATDSKNVTIVAPNAAIAGDGTAVPYRAKFNRKEADAAQIKVYGTSSTKYGKFINRIPEGEEAVGSYVNIKKADATVYSVYVDGTKVYMDPLQVVDGEQVVAPGETVIIKTTNAKTGDDYSYIEYTTTAVEEGDGEEGHYVASTMRYDGTGEIQNDLFGLEREGDDFEYGSALKVDDTVLYVLADLTKGFNWLTPADNVRLYDNTVYIYVDAEEAGRLTVIWLDNSEDLTAIKTVKKANAGNSAIYNLAGQKVNAAYKGVVIKDGKKYIQK